MSAAARTMLGDFSRYGAIDTTCHLGQWPHRLNMSASEHDLSAYAERHLLEAVWVSHLAALFGFDTRTGNEDCLRRCLDIAVLRPMAVINPVEATWEQEMGWAVEMGFHGIRIAPGYHGYGLEDMVEVARATAAESMVLQILFRLDDERVRHPQSPARDVAVTDAVKLVRAVPDATLLISGLNWGGWQELTDGLDGQVPPTVHADFWHVNGPFGVPESLAEDPERWVFGSGYPVQSPEPTMLQVTASLLAEPVRAAIVRDNALRIGHMMDHPSTSHFDQEAECQEIARIGTSPDVRVPASRPALLSSVAEQASPHDSEPPP